MMASAEQLPSGRWRGVYYDYSRKPAKQRVPGTYRLKREALKEAKDGESKALRRTSSASQFSASATYAEWLDYWWPKRALELQTQFAESQLRDRVILPRWGAWKLKDIGRNDIQDWVDELRKDLKPATVERYFNLFRASLNAAVNRDVIYGMPWRGVVLPRVSKNGKQHFEENELVAVKKHLSPLYQQVVDVLVDTGMRPGELAGLHRDHVHHGWIVVEEARAGNFDVIKKPKDDDSREVPLTTRAQQILAKWAEKPPRRGCGMEHQSKKVCVSDVAWRGVWGQPFSTDTFRKTLTRAMRRAEIAKVEPAYALRHTFGSRLAAAGVDAFTIARLMGHASTNQSQGYIHSTAGERDRVVAALEGQSGLRDVSWDKTWDVLRPDTTQYDPVGEEVDQGQLLSTP